MYFTTLLTIQDLMALSLLRKYDTVMFDLLFKGIKQKIDISDDELKMLKPFFVPKLIKKKHRLLLEGDVCLYTAFVVKGVLRSYTIDDKGVEHIIQFATEGWWIADMYSFLTGTASTYTIDALEDCELLLISASSTEEMLNKHPKMERFYRLLFQKNIIAIHNRLVCSLTQTTEEKYLQMNEDYPALLQRVPQHMIASFLGITPESLSRIRKQLSLRN